MAPSSNRRSSYSRRAQYSTFIGYSIGAVGVLAGAVLLIVSIASPNAFSFLRGIGSDVTAPVARSGARARSGSQGIVATVVGYFEAGQKNRELKRELDAAKVKLVESRGLAEENRRLKTLLDLADDDPRPFAHARLISSTSASTRRFATLSIGANRGVVVGMPVRSPTGLVGRVLEVNSTTARVLLITDTESVVPIRRTSDGVPAFAQGRSDGMLDIRLINLGVNPLKPGDTFVTSGSGGLYRPNIAIAVAMQTTRDGAKARVLSDPAASEYVAVEPIWTQPAPPELPPRPEAVPATPAPQAAP